MEKESDAFWSFSSALLLIAIPFTIQSMQLGLLPPVPLINDVAANFTFLLLSCIAAGCVGIARSSIRYIRGCDGLLIASASTTSSAGVIYFSGYPGFTTGFLLFGLVILSFYLIFKTAERIDPVRNAVLSIPHVFAALLPSYGRREALADDRAQGLSARQH